MFPEHQKLQGVMVFGSNGTALNLAKKGETQDIKALYVDAHTATVYQNKALINTVGAFLLASHRVAQSEKRKRELCN